MTHPYTVAIIADPSYGKRLVDVAERIDCWVVHSVENRKIVEDLWKRKHTGLLKFEVTIFTSPSKLESKEEWASVLESVELHHGEYSHAPPVSRLEIFGASATEESVAAFAVAGYVVINEEKESFHAAKRA